MKRTYMTLAIVAALSLTACGGSSSNHNSVVDNDAEQTHGSVPDGKGSDYEKPSDDDQKDNKTDDQKDKKDQSDKDTDKDKKTDTDANDDNSSSTGGTTPTPADPPKPEKPTLDETPLKPNDPANLAKYEKPDGDGSVVVHWGDKFKAMNSVNPNLGSTAPSAVNDDGTRKNLDTKWDAIKITKPNTIVGNSEPSDTTKGPAVSEAAEFDVAAAKDSEQTLTIKLDDTNGSVVQVKYNAQALNLGKEKIDGKESYVAQSVHVFGKAGNKNLPVEVAYVYGNKTPDQFKGVNIPGGGSVKYEGIATYLKHGETNVVEGTSEFSGEFGETKGKSVIKIHSGKIEIPGKNPIEFNSITMKGKTSFASSAFNNKGSFIKDPTGEPQLRGRFYGEQAQYLGGTFYDNEGAGTFFGGDKKRGGTTIKAD